MLLTIYIDFKSPASYLSFKPALALLDRHKISVKWLPFRTRQETIPELQTSETRGDTHRRVRAIARRDTHLLYADAQQTAMAFPSTPGETDMALAALLTIEESREEFIQAAFEAYWKDNANLNNAEVVSQLLDKTNANIAAGDNVFDIQQLDECQLTAEAAGVVEAPAFIIDGQIFIGREHLPWIEKIITS